MIIHSNKSLKNDKSILSNPKTKQSVVTKNEVEEKATSKKKKNKKSIPAPVIEETPVIVEGKIEEDIDLSEWLKDDIDE